MSSFNDRLPKWHEFPHIAFDLDGTLVDSNVAHVWAWQDAIEEAGLFFPHLTLFIQMGLPGPQIVEKFSYAFPDKATAGRIAERAARLYADHYVNLVAPFDGVLPLLRQLKRLDRRLYALTSASRVEADAMIERFGLGPYFDTVLTSGDTTEGKPSPAPFSELKERIGARAKLISVGDSPFDLRSSQSAGVPFVYVGHGGFPREWFKRAYACYFNARELASSLPKAARKAA